MTRQWCRIPLRAFILSVWLGISLSAEAQTVKDSTVNRVVSIVEDAAGGSVHLTTSAPHALPPPTVQYLPGDAGETIMVADFHGVEWANAPKLFFPASAGIKQVRIGQVQESPPVCRIAITTTSLADLKHLSFRATPGSLTIHWPGASVRTAPPRPHPTAHTPVAAAPPARLSPQAPAATHQSVHTAPATPALPPRTASVEPVGHALPELRPEIPVPVTAPPPTRSVPPPPPANEPKKPAPSTAQVEARPAPPLARVAEKAPPAAPEIVPSKPAGMPPKAAPSLALTPARPGALQSALTSFSVKKPLEPKLEPRPETKTETKPDLKPDPKPETRPAPVARLDAVPPTAPEAGTAARTIASEKATPAPPAAPLAPVVSVVPGQPTRIDVAHDRPIVFRSFRLHDPERYVIDLKALPELSSREPVAVPGNPYLTSLRFGRPEGDESTGRIVLDLTSPDIDVREEVPEGQQSLAIVVGGSPAIGELHVPPGKTVVIDAGHGGSDPGAQRGDIQEKELTLQIADKLRRTLEKGGARVVMTRTDDSYISLEDRVNLTNSVAPDVFVSVHINSLETNSTIHGIETYYQNGVSKDLAVAVHGALVNKLSAPDRSVRKARFYVINHTPVPAILAEVGFISNKDERGKLISSDYQANVADGLARGVILYLAKRPDLAQSARGADNAVAGMPAAAPERPPVKAPQSLAEAAGGPGKSVK